MLKGVSSVLLGSLLVVAPIAGGCATTPSRRSPKVATGKDQPGVYHTVKRHQTLWRICKTYGVNMDEVMRVNGIGKADEISTGQRIFIPGAKKVLQVDIYIEDLGVPATGAKKVDYASVKGNFIWPVHGPVLRRFGWSKDGKHDGIDIAAPTGTPINAMDSGKVIYSGNEIKGYGNIIIIKHGDVFTSVYAHNAVNLVHEGDQVKKGDMIARVGTTGRTTGSHVHFEIRNHNKPIDPYLVLP